MTYTQTDMSITLGLALLGMGLTYLLGLLQRKSKADKPEPKRFEAKEQLTVKDWPDYATKAK